MIIELIVIFVCLIGSAFFSASETAYNLANESQLEKKAESGFVNNLAYKICKSYNFSFFCVLPNILLDIAFKMR